VRQPKAVHSPLERFAGARRGRGWRSRAWKATSGVWLVPRYQPGGRGMRRARWAATMLPGHQGVASHGVIDQVHPLISWEVRKPSKKCRKREPGRAALRRAIAAKSPAFLNRPEQEQGQPLHAVPSHRTCHRKRSRGPARQGL